MPIRSKAQQRFLFARFPKMAERWAKETPNIKGLPERISRNKKRKLFKD
jgi:hypothetical protein